MTVSIIDFIDDEQLFAKHFRGSSWQRWRAVLKGAFALPMTPVELELFQEAAGRRAPPRKPVRELGVLCWSRWRLELDWRRLGDVDCRNREHRGPTCR